MTEKSVRTILEMKNITKIYPNGVMANKNINLSVQEGEIHALMGENGAGKSTLMKILFSMESYDSGEIWFNGNKLSKNNSAETIKMGIGMVHQHFMLVDSLTVYENVVLGIEPKKNLRIDTQRAIQTVKDLGNKYNLKVNPMLKIKDISVGLKQKVEILKVLARGAELLILDEPTAVLTPQETEELFRQLLLLKQSGHTIIFISHKIKEVMAICDRITVLRDGRHIGTMDAAGITEEEISRLMVGRDVVLKTNKSKAEFGETLLKVEILNYRNKQNKQILNNVSFELKKSQILGIAGVEGNGQNELAECVFGMLGADSGDIRLNGKNIFAKSINEIRRLRVSYIPEDRMTLGICKSASIWENIVSDRIDNKSLKKNGLINHKKIRGLTKNLIKSFNILCRNEDQPVDMLSGGNMQKVVVAREFSSDPALLIANQPTRGIDVGANEFIWKEIIKLRNQGKGILLISADLNEIMELSDSILVMCNGEIAAYFEDSSETDVKELGLYMLGPKKQNPDDWRRTNEN